MPRPPQGIYPGETNFYDRRKPIGYKATGEFRCPKAGEYYLSGAIIQAYRANFDLGIKYWIAAPGKVTTVTTQTWEPLRGATV